MKSAKRPKILLALTAAATCALGLAAAAPAHAEDEPVIQKLEHGEVNWTRKTILATGTAPPEGKGAANVASARLAAERTAQKDAAGKILDALKSVKLGGDRTGADRLSDPDVRLQAEGVVELCKNVDTRYYADGGVDVVLRCPLDGPLSIVLAPAKLQKPMADKGERKHTALIVDASGLKVHPALSPRLLDEDGGVLYGAEVIQPAALRQHGVAAYARSVEAAKHDPRAGATPLVVKASSLGPGGTDLVIPKTEAAKWQGESLGFFADGKVLIALETGPAQAPAKH